MGDLNTPEAHQMVTKYTWAEKTSQQQQEETGRGETQRRQAGSASHLAINVDSRSAQDIVHGLLLHLAPLLRRHPLHLLPYLLKLLVLGIRGGRPLICHFPCVPLPPLLPRLLPPVRVLLPGLLSSLDTALMALPGCRWRAMGGQVGQAGFR
jgi:hypothetical protein